MAKNPLTVEKVRKMITICEQQVAPEDQVRLAKFFKKLLPEGIMRDAADVWRKRAGRRCGRPY